MFADNAYACMNMHQEVSVYVHFSFIMNIINLKGLGGLHVYANVECTEDSGWS